MAQVSSFSERQQSIAYYTNELNKIVQDGIAHAGEPGFFPGTTRSFASDAEVLAFARYIVRFAEMTDEQYDAYHAAILRDMEEDQ